jgi:hypothetical protein
VAVERYKIWDISYHADCPQKCTLQDLWLANKKGFDVAQYWAKKSLINGPDTTKKEGRKKEEVLVHHPLTTDLEGNKAS